METTFRYSIDLTKEGRRSVLRSLRAMIYGELKCLRKVGLWFKTKNPSLGMVTPQDMIDRGQLSKLCVLVAHAIEENKRGTT